MPISLIAAIAENGVIGQTGTVLPWKLPADLVRFKEVTMGHPIIMGRKTYESIGRPLPGRTNIVITRQDDFTAEGCTVVTSLDEALKMAAQTETDEAFIIGGAQIFGLAIGRADKLYFTKVHAEPAGDVYFHYDPADWREVFNEDHPQDDRNEYPYSFMTFERKTNE
ncbi:MAG: type 3 dihydrofolate reductase [Candidatus Saccharimonadales bacterium]